MASNARRVGTIDTRVTTRQAAAILIAYDNQFPDSYVDVFDTGEIEIWALETAAMKFLTVEVDEPDDDEVEAVQ